MDAVKYLKESKRMCDTIGDCEKCPLDGLVAVIPCQLSNSSLELADPETAVKIVKEWVKDNPKKTRQSEFLKMYPNAKLDESGVLILCPLHIDKEYRSSMAQALYCFKPSCSECCKSYWLEEIE